MMREPSGFHEPSGTAHVVAVVVPVYNRRQLVIDSLERVRLQARPPCVLVIVDDGSTDNTAEAVERWAKEKNPAFELRLIRQSNRGASAARNRGAAAARDCEYLAFLDSDDLWPGDFLERTLLALDADPNLVAASVPRRILDLASGEWLNAPLPDPWNTEGFFKTIPVPSTTLIRADAFDRAGGYCEGLLVRNDIDFHLRLSLRGGWRLLRGEPVVMRRGTAALGGAPHLSEGILTVEQRLVRARVLDRFIHLHGGAGAVKSESWKASLGNQWLKIGRLYFGQRRFRESAWCVRRALHFRKSSPGHWLWAALTASHTPVEPASNLHPPEWVEHAAPPGLVTASRT